MTKRITPDIEAFARIRVVGAGGSGQNAVDHMVNSKVEGVDFIAVNTDAQALHRSKASQKIHIGKTITRGLGTGMNPELGKRAAEETREEIQEVLKGSDAVFITCGMGGGTGTGAAPVVASIARELGALTIGIVTKPFSFEGQQRARLAYDGLTELRKSVDALITIPNDRILAIVNRDTGLKNAFAMCDDVLKQAVEGISDLITTPGIINVDFADVRAVMQNAGSALMGVGIASGEKRAEEAARAAISSPLLEVSISGAKGVLFSVAGGDDLGMLEIQDAANVITEAIDEDAKVIFGAIVDNNLKKGQVKVTVIATGFPESGFKSSLFDSHKTTAPLSTTSKDTTTEKDDDFLRPRAPERSNRGSFEIPITTAKAAQERAAAAGKSTTPPASSPTTPATPPTPSPSTDKKTPDTPPAKKSSDSIVDDLLDGDDNWSVPSFLRRKK